MWDKWDFLSNWEETTPKRVQHGIKAIHQKGQFCEQWWGKRWIEIIDSYNLGERLNRGKRYARAGQVVELNFLPGLITASVQGSRSLPYQVQLTLKTWSEKQWEKVFSYVKADPLLLTQLISGKLPPDLEQKLKSQGIDLFPGKFQDFATDCSCPDISNPCKHIAAVFFLISESLDKNPFLLFEMRGKDQTEIIDNLLSSKTETEEIIEPVTSKNKPLTAEHFWEGCKDKEVPAYYIKPMEYQALLIHQMGPFPLWQANDNFFDWWARLYQYYTKKVIEQME